MIREPCVLHPSTVMMMAITFDPSISTTDADEAAAESPTWLAHTTEARSASLLQITQVVVVSLANDYGRAFMLVR